MSVKRRRLLAVLAATASTFAVLGGGTTVAAAPAAPAFVDPNISNAALKAELDDIVNDSNGNVALESIGTTNENRPILFAKVGTGPVRVLYVTQQHGNEPLGTPAAVQLLRDLGVGNAQQVLRSKITLGIVVRANPDGHAHNWRHNFDPTADPEFGQKGEGYDINRYHNRPPAQNPVPEAVAIINTHAQFKPSIFVDYHMQGPTNCGGQAVKMSLLWPTNAGVSPAIVTESKRVTVAAKKVSELLNQRVSRYTAGGTFEGIARNAYGLNGSRSLLVELSRVSGANANQTQMLLAYSTMLDIAQKAGNNTFPAPTEADTLCPGGTPLDAEDHDHAA